jgi:hypothetical protein
MIWRSFPAFGWSWISDAEVTPVFHVKRVQPTLAGQTPGTVKTLSGHDRQPPGGNLPLKETGSVDGSYNKVWIGIASLYMVWEF